MKSLQEVLKSSWQTTKIKKIEKRGLTNLFFHGIIKKKREVRKMRYENTFERDFDLALEELERKENEKDE